MMKIKIFIASSSELKLERLEFVDMIQQFNDILEHRGMQIKPIKWEHLDASMGVERKQDEYNKELRQCEICLVLYWKTFGEYTTEEFNTAYQGLSEGNNPQKIYVYFKEASEISKELRSFRDSFPTRYGHFYCTFDNVDTMRLHFLLQLEAYLCTDEDDKLIEVNKDSIEVDGQHIASFNSIDFVNRNQEYQKLLQALEKQKRRLVKYPDDEEEIEELTRIESELKSFSDGIIETSRLFVNLSAQKMTSRLLAAREHFLSGDLRTAESILDMKEILGEIGFHTSHIQELTERISIEQELIQASKEAICLHINECRLKIQFLKTSVPPDYRQKIGEIYKNFLPKISIIQDNDLYHKVLSECDSYIDEILLVGLLLRDLRLYQESLVFYHCAADCLRPLSAQEPGLYLGKLACIIGVISQIYHNIDDHDSASKYSQESAGILHEVLKINPHFEKKSLPQEYQMIEIESPLELTKLISCRTDIARHDCIDTTEINQILDECIPLLDKYEVIDAYTYEHYNGIYQSLLSNISLGLMQAGRTEDALKVFNRHKVHCDTYNLLLDSAEISNYLGVVYDKLGNEQKAENEFYNSISTLEKLEASYGRNTAIISALRNYSDLLINQENFSFAQTLLENAALYAEELSLQYHEACILEELGDLNYYNIDNDEAAASIYHKAIVLFEELQANEKHDTNYYSKTLLKLYLNRGHSLQLTNDIVKCKECYETCMNLIYSNKDLYENEKNLALQLYYRTGRLCFDHGDSEDGKKLWAIAQDIGYELENTGTISKFSKKLLTEISSYIAENPDSATY